MMKAIGKTLASLALAGALLTSPLAQAFPEPRPVDLSAEGLQRFVQTLPTDGTVGNGLQRAIDECIGCQPESPELVTAVVGYLDGLFDYYHYDLGATLAAYSELRLEIARTPRHLVNRDQLSWLSASGMDDFMLIVRSPIRIGQGQALIDAGILTPDEVRAAEALLEAE